MAFHTLALHFLEVVYGAHRRSGSIVSLVAEALRLAWFGGPWKSLTSWYLFGYEAFLTLTQCSRYASVAFGLPCGIDDSDCDVQEIDDSFPGGLAALEPPVTPLTYHKLKGQLYRIMGPFLSRKKQINRLGRLQDVHRALQTWYAAVPGILKCDTGGSEFQARPILMQMQAIALQLAYDNLQMVLFRHAVFPKDPGVDLDADRLEGIRQLSNSAIRTASISKFPATALVCTSSHAAMHVGICSFTAGVILCTLLAHQTHNQDNQSWLASLRKIITLFENFPSANYRLATQSLQLLKALELRVNRGISDTSLHPRYSDDPVQAGEFIH